MIQTETTIAELTLSQRMLEHHLHKEGCVGTIQQILEENPAKAEKLAHRFVRNYLWGIRARVEVQAVTYSHSADDTAHFAVTLCGLPDDLRNVVKE